MREILERVFGLVCNLSLVGSYCIVLVLFTRLVLRRAPRWCSYLLWGIVFLRLCCPVVPQTPVSLIPERLVAGQTASISLTATGDTAPNAEDTGTRSEAEQLQASGTAKRGDDSSRTEAFSQDTQDSAAVTGQTGTDTMAPETALTQTTTGEAYVTTASTPDGVTVHSTQPLKTLAEILFPCLWLFGFLGFTGYHLFSYLRMYHRLRQPGNGVRRVEDGIYEIEGGHLSFVMGIVHPTIYLSAGLSGQSREVVLCHERIHLQRRDYLIKPAALLVCCVHWFNPLVWLAFYLMNMDCEMSCDEKVVKLLGEESKKTYSYTLLNEATDGRWKRYRGGTICALLSFGEDHVKNRIHHVLNYRMPSYWILCAAGVLIIGLILCLCSNPGADAENVIPEPTLSEKTGELIDISDTEYSDNAIWTQEEWDAYADKLAQATPASRFDFSEFYSPERIEETHSFAQEKGWYVNPWRYAGDPTNWEMFWESSSDGHGVYEDYKDPVTAARKTLQLGAGEGVVTEVLYEAARQYQLYSDHRLGEGSVVNVEYTFQRDGSVIEIPMVLAEEKQQIWLLSTGDLGSAAQQKIGPLPGEQSARRVYVEYEAYSPENMPPGQYTEYLETKIGSYTGSGIHIQVSSCGIYVMYNHIFQCVAAADIPENMGSAAICDRIYYNTSNAYNEKVQEDNSIGWMGSKVFYMTEAAEHLQEDGRPTRYTVKEYSLADGSGWELTEDGEADPVLPFSMKAENGFVTVYNGNGELYQQYPVSGPESGADDLAQEARDQYAVEWREDILSHPGMVCDVSQRTASETYALIDLDGDAAAERISLQPDDTKSGDGPVDYTFGVDGIGENRHARLLDNSILAFSPDGEQIVIALYETGDDGKTVTVFFTYDGEKLQQIKKLEADIRREWITDEGIYLRGEKSNTSAGQWVLWEETLLRG